MNIRAVGVRNQALLEQLLAVWEGSVRATHLFLSDTEIRRIKEYVPEALAAVPHLIVAEKGGAPAAFMGIEALYCSRRTGPGFGPGTDPMGHPNLRCQRAGSQ